MSHVFLRALVASTCFLPAVFAGQQNRPSESDKRGTLVDVRLPASGKLTFTIVSDLGKPLADQVVALEYKGKTICRSKSDSSGNITILGLRAGLHTIRAANTARLYRFWTSAAAPPSAISNPAVVLSQSAVRGQYEPMPLMGAPMMGPGMLATGVTATALAVVLAGKSSASGSSYAPPASP